MTWQKTPTDERYVKGGIILARIFWGGNLWICNVFPPGQHQETTTDVSLEQAKIWAEEKLK